MGRCGTQAKSDHDMQTEGKTTTQLRQPALTICKIQKKESILPEGRHRNTTLPGLPGSAR